MSLKQLFADQLELAHQAEAVGARNEQTPVTATDGGDSLSAVVPAIDQIGCAVTSLSLQSDRFAQASIDQLKAVSDDLSSRLNYLLEPISPIEIDAEGATVQMRSNPPQRDDDGSSYYELTVRTSGLNLCRYTKPRGGQRQVIPANVTREVLMRLVGDFCEQQV